MNQLMNFQITGVIVLVAGIAIRYVIAKRVFNRRAVTGMQLFRSCGQSLFTRFLEWIAKLTGTLIIIIGAILLIWHYVKQ
jgi:uncharacterized membrane protein